MQLIQFATNIIMQQKKHSPWVGQYVFNIYFCSFFGCAIDIAVMANVLFRQLY
jgi:hypothetical protein